jgi:hypothetical protein
LGYPWLVVADTFDRGLVSSSMSDSALLRIRYFLCPGEMLIVDGIASGIS